MSSVDLPLSMQSVPSFFGAPIGDIEDLSEKKNSGCRDFL
jgi:agmatinase